MSLDPAPFNVAAICFATSICGSASQLLQPQARKELIQDLTHGFLRGLLMRVHGDSPRAFETMICPVENENAVILQHVEVRIIACHQLSPLGSIHTGTILERAGNRVRTDDLLITNQLLYQLSYAGNNARSVAQ
jgi:hypothetical protein